MKLFRRTETSPEASLAAVLGDVDLPTFPNVVVTALDMLAAQADLAAVADVVVADPGLSVRLLRLANSSAFAPRMPISSVQRAAVMMGRNQLESVLISTAVVKSVPSTGIPGCDSGAFWHTAAVRASAAAMVAGGADPAHRSEHFTAALLQDMAQPLLAAAHDSYRDLWAGWHGAHDGMVDAESDRMGWSHVDAAVAMGRRWEFPDTLISLISVHHDDAGHDHDVGHRIARWASLLGDTDSDEVVDLAGEWFGLRPPAVIDLLDAAATDADAIALLFR